MTDQTPEARLAAVQGQLHADVCGAEHQSPVQDQWWCKQIAERLLALPTLAADLALAEKVRWFTEHDNVEFWSGNPVLGDWPFYVRIGERPAHGGDTPLAAITAAIEAEVSE